MPELAGAVQPAGGGGCRGEGTSPRPAGHSLAPRLMMLMGHRCRPGKRECPARRCGFVQAPCPFVLARVPKVSELAYGSSAVASGAAKTYTAKAAHGRSQALSFG